MDSFTHAMQTAFLSRPLLSQRRLGASLALLIACAVGNIAWFTVCGERLAHDRLIYALSTTVPAWADWNVAGARETSEALPVCVSVALCAVWTCTQVAAAHTRDKRIRPILLIAAFLGLVGCIGAGDLPTAVTAGVAVVATGLLVKRFSGQPDRALKIILTGLGATVLACTGILVVWKATFPAETVDVSSRILRAAIATGILAYGASALRRRRTPPGTVAAGIAAAVALALYPGNPSAGFAQSWSDRSVEIRRQACRLTHRELIAELDAYRPSAKEAAIVRLPRAEAGTAWNKTDDLLRKSAISAPAVARWLAADASSYGPKSVADRQKMRAALLGEPASGDSFENDMRGWLLLAGSDATGARKAFDAAPRESAMSRLGAGLSALAAGDEDAAVGALTRFCELDPRALFSPAWDREPMVRVKTRVIQSWIQSVRGGESAPGKRFAVWLACWERADGNMRRFLEDPRNDAPVSPAIAQVRARLLETLRSPDDARIGAIFSSGVAMLTDRHVNLGQCHALFAACAGGEKAKQIPERTLITRPTMAGWSPLPTEGGAGASLHDFEENLLVRLVTYGNEPVR